MKIQDQVTTLETSKKLQATGYILDTYWWHCKLLTSHQLLSTSDTYWISDDEKWSAPSFSELLGLVPAFVNYKDEIWYLAIIKGNEELTVRYQRDEHEVTMSVFDCFNVNHAEVLAEVLFTLITKGVPWQQ